MSNSKGFDAAHDCVDIIESYDLEPEERHHCFHCLNQYYKLKNERDEVLKQMSRKNSYFFLIGPGGRKD